SYRSLDIGNCVLRPLYGGQRPTACRQSKRLILQPASEPALLDGLSCRVKSLIPIAARQGDLCPRLGKAQAPEPTVPSRRFLYNLAYLNLQLLSTANFLPPCEIQEQVEPRADGRRHKAQRSGQLACLFRQRLVPGVVEHIKVIAGRHRNSARQHRPDAILRTVAARFLEDALGFVVAATRGEAEAELRQRLDDHRDLG